MDSRSSACHSKLHDFLLMKWIPVLLTVPQVSVHCPGRNVPWLPCLGWSSDGNSQPQCGTTAKISRLTEAQTNKMRWRRARRPPSESCLGLLRYVFSCFAHVEELLHFVITHHSHWPASARVYYFSIVEIIESKNWTFRNLVDINCEFKSTHSGNSSNKCFLLTAILICNIKDVWMQ